ncbi:MAG: hypothetical protein JWN04_4208 [Myxococcaceae bacterium]|nr:hypothetical protein [Myxococcaceae bacterium]
MVPHRAPDRVLPPPARGSVRAFDRPIAEGCECSRIEGLGLPALVGDHAASYRDGSKVAVREISADEHGDHSAGLHLAKSCDRDHRAKEHEGRAVDGAGNRCRMESCDSVNQATFNRDRDGPLSRMQDRNKIAVRDERFNDFVRLRSITRVAKLHGVSTQAIRKQAQAGEWKVRVLELDRANAISRKVVASQRTLEKLDRIEEVIEAELDALEEPDEDRDDLKRAGLATAVLTEAAKAKREAMADLPDEPEPELNLSPLSNAAFAVWLAQGQLAAALKAARTAPYVAPSRGESAAIIALLESDVGREFLREYEREHPQGLQTMGLV